MNVFCRVAENKEYIWLLVHAFQRGLVLQSDRCEWCNGPLLVYSNELAFLHHNPGGSKGSIRTWPPSGLSMGLSTQPEKNCINWWALNNLYNSTHNANIHVGLLNLLSLAVMWSETVGLRTRSVTDQKKSVLVLISIVLSTKSWSCRSGVVLSNTVLSRSCSCLEKNSNFSSNIYSFSILCLEHQHQLWKSTVVSTYLKVKSAKFLCLLPVPWSWSYEFGLV